jgi:hypothetical protein
MEQMVMMKRMRRRMKKMMRTKMWNLEEEFDRKNASFDSWSQPDN